MTENLTKVKFVLRIDEGENADQVKIDRSTRQLYSELDEMDLGSIGYLEDPNPPEGTKQINAVLIGVIALEITIELLPKMVGILTNWTGRSPERKIVLEYPDKETTKTINITYKNLKPEDVNRIVNIINLSLGEANIST